MIGAGAEIHGEPGLGLQHQHRDVLLRERQRDQQSDRPGAGDDDLGFRQGLETRD